MWCEGCAVTDELHYHYHYVCVRVCVDRTADERTEGSMYDYRYTISTIFRGSIVFSCITRLLLLFVDLI